MKIPYYIGGITKTSSSGYISLEQFVNSQLEPKDSIVSLFERIEEASKVGDKKLKTKLKEDLAKIISGPYEKLKAERLKRKNRIKQKRTKNKAERAKARRNLAIKVAKNAAKTLAPIIALQLTNQLIAVISQRGKLETLVNQVNNYITSANTPETIQIAINLRNNTITLINNSINKLQSIKKVTEQITLYITIFSLIVAILSAIPIPVAVPPGIGIPFNLITKIVKTLEKANKLIASLSVVLAICTVLLENEISKLNEITS